MYGNMQHQDSEDTHITSQKGQALLSGGIMHHIINKIKTFPHHKHVGETILESDEMEIEDILRELEKMIMDDLS